MLVIQADRLRSHTYTYSPIGQLLKEAISTRVDRTITRSYNAGPAAGGAGRYTGMTLSSTAGGVLHELNLGFDGAGRINQVSSPAGVYSYTRVDSSSLLASIQGPVHRVALGYEPYRDLMVSRSNEVGASPVSAFLATYNDIGKTTGIERAGSAFTPDTDTNSVLKYDLLGQLVEDHRFPVSAPPDPSASIGQNSFGFLYDGIGNRISAQHGETTTSYTVNELNQYTDIDGIEPIYDADGNLIADGHRRFLWDAENRLTLVEPIVPGQGSYRVQFRYDYMGRRVSKQVWTHTGGTWTDTSSSAFVYDGWNLIEEIHSPGAPSESSTFYTWGLDLSLSLQGAGGVGGLLAHTHTDSSGSSQTFHYTYDLNGNVS